MNIGMMRSAMMLALLVAPCGRAADGKPFPWPDGKRAAVSLAYDDALDSQLDNAIPALDRHGFKGSFYLTLSSDVVWRRLAEWRQAARDGHELGNHTLFHQCSGSSKGHEWVEPQRDLDSTGAAQMKDQVLLANAMLHSIDGQRQRTFTVPCGDVMAQGTDYAALVSGEFVAIKLGQGAVVPDMDMLDLAAVPVEAPADASGEHLVALIEQAARKGTMVNLTFHGIGGDYLAVSVQAHETLLQYLAAHRDIYWVDTFVNVAEYVRQQKASHR